MSESSGPSLVSAKPFVSVVIKALKRFVAIGPFLVGLFGVPMSSLWAQTPTPVPVLTWRYDLTHAGQNTGETALTPVNVKVNTFGKLFELAVDSTVYAQPLYVPGLTMSDGLMHNVLFVATESDSIYAFDADSNGGANANPIWHVSLLTAAHGAGAGATAVPWEDTASPDVAPTSGITGTPAIDPSTNTLYVVAATKEGGAYFSRLHAINILTGAERANSPSAITATVAGTGNGSSGGQLTFSPLWENQRGALNYYNGYVYFGYAAHGDNGPWHGWLFAYNASTMKQSAVLCLSPNDVGAGLWGSGAGMPIDNDAAGGRMFAATGNGALSTYPPFTASSNLSMSVLTFSLANGGLKPTDAFTSFNYVTLNKGDLDQGSGGVLMVPDQQGSNPHVLVQAGKEGRILVLNRDKLGGYNKGGTSNTNALQEIAGKIKGMWATPAYWNGNVYFWAENDVPKLFKLNNGVMDTEPDSLSTIMSAFPSPTFSISSNGAQDGVAWAVRSDQFNTNGPAVLYAWDATDLATPIYESDTKSARDSAGAANKFSIPIVTNGKVYVAAHGEVDVYGLFSGEPTAVAPSITPDGGTFAAGQSVKLTSLTSAADIYYTLDDSTPTTASTLYAGPIPVSTDTTVKAIASAPGFLQSRVSSATFTFTGQTPPLAFAPAAGIYLAAQHVTIANTDTKAKIYYTIDGSVPSVSSHLYSVPILVSISETIKAIAIDPSLQNSDVGTSAYVIQTGGASIDFGSGFSSTAGLTLNGSTVASNDTRLQLTNGGLWEGGSVFWNAPINIQAFTANFEFQLSLAQGNGFTFAIQNNGPTALGGDSAGLGYQNILKSVAVKFNFYDYEGEGSNSTGVYTDGEPPLLPTVDISPSGIELASGDSINAQVTYDGTILSLKLHDLVTSDDFAMSKAIDIPLIVGGNAAWVGFTGGTGGLSASQKILTWTYATQSLPPKFTPGAGSLSAGQKVALSSTTADAAIYYTTNRTMPTAASTRYSGPIPVTASETIEAVAISPTVGSSIVKSAVYTVQAPASFSLSTSPAKAIARGGSTTSIITITPKSGFTGSVTLKCAITTKPSGAIDVPTCSVAKPAAIAGTRPVMSTLTFKTQAATSPGAYAVTVTGSTSTLDEKAKVAVTVIAPTFALSGKPISIASPGKSATSTITVTPKAGFKGSVALRCAITTRPAGAIDIPTCQVTQPASITGTLAVTAKLTIKTQAATSQGAYTVTVKGSSSGVVERTSLAIKVAGAAL